MGTKISEETHCSIRQIVDKREVQKELQGMYNITTCKSMTIY